MKLAITLVGIRTIKNFSLWSAVFSLMPNPKCGPFDLKSLWQDSLRRALFARAMARMMGIKEVEEPFSAALLQDMAVPLLAKAAPAAYERLLNARRDGKVRLSVLEQHVFGWTHAEAAGIIARLWNLPEAFAVLIENHLEVDRWIHHPKAEPGKLVVALSAMLPTSADRTWNDRTQLEHYYDAACPAGGLPLVQVLAKIDEEYTDFAPVLKLSTPSKSLMDCYDEIAAAT